MSENKTSIKTLNGHPLFDEVAREAAKKNTDDIAHLSEEKLNKNFGSENALELLVVAPDGTITTRNNLPSKKTYTPDIIGHFLSDGSGIGLFGHPEHTIHTDYIPLNLFNHLTYYARINQIAYKLAFFDADKVFMPECSIIGDTGYEYNGGEMDIPEGAAYCILSDYTEGRETQAYVTLSNTGIDTGKGLTDAQKSALNEMFKVCAYTSSAEAAYAAFCSAFGIETGVE